MIGRVLALQTVLVAGTTPIGGPLLGAISDAVGARAPVVLGGLATLAAAAFGALAARREHALPTAPGGDVPSARSVQSTSACPRS